jgi:hypothetical protein
MAGNWIKFEKSLPSKPEVFRISSACRADRFSVSARLCMVWAWADELTEDGIIPDSDASILPMIDEIAGLEGFGQAMIDVGWLVAENGKPLSFPKFTRHNTNSAKRRAMDASRIRKKSTKTPHDKRRKCGPHNKTLQDSIEGTIVPSGKAKKQRQPDPVWDAVATEWFPSGVTKSEQTRVGKIVSDLKAKGVTDAGQITERIAMYRARWPDMDCTPEAIVKHWDQVKRNNSQTISDAFEGILTDGH